MNQQKKIYQYDQEEYQKHLERIKKYEQREKQLLAQYSEIDKHFIDNCIQPSGAASIEQQLSVLRNKLHELRHRQITIVDSTNENSNIITLNHRYHAQITFPNGDSQQHTFKLVEVKNDANISIDTVSVASPIGKAILGKEIGEVCTFTVGNSINQVVVLKEIKKEQTQPQAEEME